MECCLPGVRIFLAVELGKGPDEKGPEALAVLTKLVRKFPTRRPSIRFRFGTSVGFELLFFYLSILTFHKNGLKVDLGGDLEQGGAGAAAAEAAMAATGGRAAAMEAKAAEVAVVIGHTVRVAVRNARPAELWEI